MSADDLPGEVRVFNDSRALATAAAAWLAECCSRPGPFRFAASGGSTPRSLYEALASPRQEDGVDWSRWHVFFGDERAVAPDDVNSNYRLLRDALLSRVAIPAQQVHRMEAESADLAGAAAEYAALLEAEAGAPPRLDVVLLGLGEDGHTASLFPGSDALSVTDAWATTGCAPVEPRNRMTLTLPVLNRAAHVVFLVTGQAKAEALRGVVRGTVPAARVRPVEGDVLWFLDDAAAQSMS